MGLYRGGKLYAIHTDHLGTPRLMTDDTNTPVWQWPYSAFGDNKPTGVLKATDKPTQAFTNQPRMLRATAPAVKLDLRMPGQMEDAGSGLIDNMHRMLMQGYRYTQPDPMGWDAGSNRFIYADANPIATIDPLGLAPMKGLYRPSDLLPLDEVGGGFAGRGIIHLASGTSRGHASRRDSDKPTTRLSIKERLWSRIFL